MSGSKESESKTESIMPATRKNSLLFIIALLGTFGLWILVGLVLCLTQKEVNFVAALDSSGSLFTALAFASTGYAIFLQRKSIEIQGRDLELQREELKETREELKGQKEQMQIQNEVHRKSAFENTFFNMLVLHSDIISKMRIRVKPTVIDQTTASQTSSKINEGRECFSRVVHNLNKLLKSGIGMSDAFKRCYLKNNYLLGHYYQNLVSIAEYICHTSFISESDKCFYASILRSQLSARELTLMFYYGLYGENSEDIKGFVERFALLKMLDKSSVDVQLWDKYCAGAYGLKEGAAPAPPPHPTASAPTPI